MRRLRVGVIGFGSIGRHHARNLAAMPDVDLVAVVDPSEVARRSAAEAGHRAFARVNELVAAGIDAAVVAVPTSYHEEVALALIERSIAVLVEKPLAHNLIAAKRVIEAAKLRGVPLMVGYVERYNPAMEQVRNFVAEGNLGTLLSISARRVGGLPPRINDANVLVDIGVHDIDIVAFITGARLHLVSAQGGMAHLTDRLDYATVYLSVNGTSVHIDTNWATPVKIRNLSITGTRGYANVDYITQEAWFVPGQSFAPTATYEALVAQYVDGTPVAMPVAKCEPLARELQVFVAGVRGEPLPDPRISLASLRIAEEATAYIAQHKLQAVVSA
ncbi:MAG: Gfo/Idh/MocA family protein [Vulcanimicrobiaceae bacterium]